MTLIRIDAPHFCAGAEYYSGHVQRSAPIIRYMRGWTMDAVAHYCRRKNWAVEVITVVYKPDVTTGTLNTVTQL